MGTPGREALQWRVRRQQVPDADVRDGAGELLPLCQAGAGQGLVGKRPQPGTPTEVSSGPRGVVGIELGVLRRRRSFPRFSALHTENWKKTNRKLN